MGLSNEPLAGVVQAWGVVRRRHFPARPAALTAVRRARFDALRTALAANDRRRAPPRHARHSRHHRRRRHAAQHRHRHRHRVLQNGAVSHLYYADRIYELPLAHRRHRHRRRAAAGLSRHLRAGNHAAVMDSQNRSFEFAMLLTVPAAVALAVAAHRHRARPVSARRLHGGRHAAHGLCPGDLRAGAAVVRDDQGVLRPPSSRARIPQRRCATPSEPDRQHAGLDRAVLPVPLAGPDAASRHRRGDHAGRLAERRPACTAPWSDAGTFVPDARLQACARAHRLASLVMGVAVWVAAIAFQEWPTRCRSVVLRAAG